MIKGYEYQSDFAKRYVAEGRERGRAEGRVEGHNEGFFEGLTQGHTEGLTEGLIKGLTEGLLTGLTRGRTEEATRNLLTVLRVRNLAVSDSARERILAQEDPERLERWLEKAAVAASVTAVLDKPN